MWIRTINIDATFMFGEINNIVFKQENLMTVDQKAVNVF